MFCFSLSDIFLAVFVDGAELLLDLGLPPALIG